MDESEAHLLEIGKLILIIHEEFLKDQDDPRKVLVALCKLIDDFGLSSDCSVLDIEIIRRRCMNLNFVMDFESFFNFLKLLADFIFSSTLGTSNLSFLSLFSEYIVPYCQQGQRNSSSKPLLYSEFDFRTLNSFLNQSFDVFVSYRQFLMHLFIHINSAEYRQTHLQSAWRSLNSNNSEFNRLTLDKILSYFKQIDIGLNTFSSKLVTNCFSNICEKNSVEYLSFPMFLLFLEELSRSIQSTSLPRESSTDDVVVMKLENIIVMLIKGTMNLTLQNFAAVDQPQFAPTNGINKGSLTLSSVIWLIRQTNLMQTEDIKLSELYNIIRIELNLGGITDSNRNSQQQSNSNITIPITTVVPLLNQLIYKTLDRSNVESLKKSHLQLQDRQALFLASNLPSAIFASYKRVPSALFLLYCMDNFQSLVAPERSVTSILSTFSTTRKSKSTNSSHQGDNTKESPHNWSISVFLEFCKKKGVIPDIIYESLVLKTCEAIFGKLAPECDDSKDVIRSFIELFEMLFVLSQYMNKFDSSSNIGGSSSSTASANPEGSLRNFNSLLKALLQHLDIKESEIKEISSSDVRLKSYADKSADQIDQHANVIANAVSKVRSDESPEEPSGNSLRDVVVLLIHFPLNSYRLNPWEIAQLFLSMNKYNEVNFLNDPRISLSYIFKTFCRHNNIRPEDLARFFAFRYEKVPTSANPSNGENIGKPQHKMVMKQSVRQALADPLLDFMLADRTLRLLYANSDLMKWEYAKAFALFKGTDPFFESVISPVLCVDSMNENGDRVMLSSSTAIAWAHRSFDLSRELAESCFKATSILGGDSISNLMPFSSFVTYSIRCYWTKFSNKLDISLEEFVDLIRGMLQVFSDSLTRVQQSIRLCILPPLMGADKGTIPFLDTNERITVAKMAGSYFESKLTSSSYFNSNSTIKFLNPKLPLRFPESRSFLCDAPRFIEFSKCLGLHQVGDTILCSWFCFGTFIRSLNPPGLESWPESVVPPLPINVDYLAILNLVNALVHIYGSDSDFNKESDGSIRGLHMILSKYMLPLLCNVHAIKTDPYLTSGNGQQLAIDNSVGSFEDILRYGGDQVIKSLDYYRSWIEECYINLVYSSGGGSNKSQNSIIEPTVNVVCSYLSLQGFLKMGTIATLVKNSLQPRVRASMYSKNLPTRTGGSDNGSQFTLHEVASISLSEFEEIIIRCAFHAWDLSGAGANSKPTPANFQCQESPKSSATISPSGSSLSSAKSQPDFIAPAFDTDEIIERYCNEASAVILAKAPNSRQTWGINFLKPFLIVVEKFGHFLKVQPKDALSKAAPISSSNVNVSNESSGNNPFDSANLRAAKNSENKIEENPLNINLLETHLQLRKNDLMSIAGGNSGDNKIRSSQPPLHLMVNSDSSGASNRKDELIKDIYQQRLSYSFKDPVLRSSVDDDSPSLSARFEIGNSNSNTHMKRSSGRDATISIDENDASFESINFLEEDAAKYFPPLNILKKSINPSSSTKHAAVPPEDNDDNDTELSKESGKSSPKTPILVAIESLLIGTKEALWPVFATYCSCGDSMEPGKLSGPNLFTLLSKLGVLSDLTVLSDVGILLHQISAHTPAHSPLAISSMRNDELCETPSLTFEEFLIFLCAFSQLRFEGHIKAPLIDENLVKSKKRLGKDEQEKWFEKWQDYMCNSKSFRRLLEECVLPVLKRHPVIASPEHARHRDRYSTIFSVDVLTAIEGSERPLQNCFKREKELALAAISRPANTGLTIEQTGSIILNALQRINLGGALQRIKLDHIIEPSHIIQLVIDVMPTLFQNSSSSSASQKSSQTPASKFNTSEMCFPQWEWILSVVAYEAVDIAVRESTCPTPPEQVPSLMADLISSIANAMKASI